MEIYASYCKMLFRAGSRSCLSSCRFRAGTQSGKNCALPRLEPAIFLQDQRWRGANLHVRFCHHWLASHNRPQHSGGGAGGGQNIFRPIFRQQSAFPAGNELFHQNIFCQSAHAGRQPVPLLLVVSHRVSAASGFRRQECVAASGRHQLPRQYLDQRPEDRRFHRSRRHLPGFRIRRYQISASRKTQCSRHRNFRSSRKRSGADLGGLESDSARQRHGDLERCLPHRDRAGDAAPSVCANQARHRLPASDPHHQRRSSQRQPAAGQGRAASPIGRRSTGRAGGVGGRRNESGCVHSGKTRATEIGASAVVVALPDGRTQSVHRAVGIPVGRKNFRFRESSLRHS